MTWALRRGAPWLVVLIGACSSRRTEISSSQGGHDAGVEPVSGAMSADGSSRPANRAGEPGQSGVTADIDPTVLVVIHSWSGRTERLGREIARMLGARVVAYHDPPIEGAPAQPPMLDHVLPDLSLVGVRTVFLGFPVWGEAPSPFVQRLVSSLKLDGVRVVPFYSFIHELQPAKLAALQQAITARGGALAPELRFLIPLAVHDQDLDRRAQRALLARRDLWSASGDETPGASCEGRNTRDGASLCQVPSGIAWMGDGGIDAPPGAFPPRRVNVRAFEIDRGEITVGQYGACVAAGACAAIDFTQSFCGELLAERPDRKALPVPCATYTSAESYCRWAGMRLPSEAEWIRAGRGETTRAFPWGDTFAGIDSPVRGNFGEKRSTGFSAYSTVNEEASWPRDGFKGIAPPCSFSAGNSPFGVCDLAGNLAEWVRTEGTSGDVAKGGSWLDAEPSAIRLGTAIPLPSVFSRQIGIYVTGIRCARDLP